MTDHHHNSDPHITIDPGVTASVGTDECPARGVGMRALKSVAGELGVSTKVVRSLVERGELPAYKIGGSLRIADEDLNDYKRHARVTTPPAPASPAGALIRRSTAGVRHLTALHEGNEDG